MGQVMITFQRMSVIAVLIFSIVISSSAFAGSQLKKIFDPEMINVNLSYLEKLTGPAKNTFNFDEKNTIQNTYKIEGCEVIVRVSNGSVRSIGFEKLGSTCTFNLNSFLTNYKGKFPPPHKMTFGQFDSLTKDGTYTSYCFHNCGNSYDPIVYEMWNAPHADQFFEIKLGVVLDSIPAIDASEKWANIMIHDKGEDWVTFAKFNCSNEYNAVARDAFKNVRITSIEIGYDLFEDYCKSKINNT